MKKIISLVLVAVMLVGCFFDSKPVEEKDPIVVVKSEEGNYDYVLPFESNYIRFSHPATDYMEIGQGLIEISKDYFSISENSLKEGNVISDFHKEFRPLVLLREGTDNPVGLNPQADIKVKVNSATEVSGPFFISDLFEVDFVSRKDNNKLTGAAFALVLNKTITDDNKRLVTVDDDVLYEFATNIAGPKLESYLRKKPELINLPIVIAVYVTDRSNESVPGNYIARAEFVNRQGQFEKIDHKWVLFPTSQGLQFDGMVNEQISSMKRSLTGFIPEDIGVVAYGEYIEGKLNNLKIKINVQSKTYTEVLALSHYVGELIMSFDTDSKVVVEIKSLTQTLAIVKRGVNASKSEVIML